ncbi:MAG: hypothetical protein R3F45_03255 [Gammaproteobacteria bacterium]
MAILMRIARDGLRVYRIFVTQLSLSGGQAGKPRWACACAVRTDAGLVGAICHFSLRRP